MAIITLTIADRAGIDWAQRQVTKRHYLHAPVDPRSRTGRHPPADARSAELPQGPNGRHCHEQAANVSIPGASTSTAGRPASTGRRT